MKYNPKYHHRRSIRLKGYDYSQAGLYFITLCCKDRACLFGEIRNGTMHLNDAGKMIELEWLKLHERFKNIKLNEYIVMPNHFHAILEIVGAPVGATDVATLVVAQKETNNNTRQPQGFAPPGKTIGDMMDAFKSITTVEYIRGVKQLGWQRFNRKLWQRNYYERIIRNKQAYENISNYIINNPANWKKSSLK